MYAEAPGLAVPPSPNGPPPRSEILIQQEGFDSTQRRAVIPETQERPWTGSFHGWQETMSE